MAVCRNGEASAWQGSLASFSAIRVQYTIGFSVVLMIDSFIHQVCRLWRDDRGADLVEYGLIAMIVALAGVVMFPTIGARLGDAFGDWGQQVYDAWEPEPPE